MEKSGFFNSNNGDRVYNAVDFAAYFGDLVSNGIFYQTADTLRVTASSGMNVTVLAGTAWINGYHYTNTTPLDLTVPTANGVYDRIDRMVLRWSNPDREIRLAVKAGTPASSPVPPELTRTADVWELGLANILVGRGAISIGGGSISDTRLNQDLCGQVNSLVLAVYE